jgi:stage II sporulation protein D
MRRALPIAVAVALLAAPVSAQPDDPDGSLPSHVRVRIGARLTLDQVRVTLPDGTTRTLGQALRGSVELPTGSRVTLVPGDVRRYVGTLVVERTGEGTVAHLRIPVDDYLAGVVASEMGATGPEAALRAQAVVSRTLLVVGGDRHPEGAWDLCDLTHCQSFRGLTDADSAVRAVAETADRVMTLGGAPVEAPFHSTCGGATLAAAGVWGTAHPHLPGVSDQRADGTAYCDGSPHGDWVAAVAGQELPDPGDEVDRFRLEAGRRHGWNLVKSNRFTATPLTFDEQRIWWLEGRGLGHGVGLCQQGAMGRARAGADADEILRAYFPGAVAASP